ncbi:hypothetical protein LTR56_019050 [Elasticomyces elasticus]|nr:hypothetical protein LTR56_019050 [Elasticomyces elasticus]KAK3645039.1 hypothetical protein LTR22_014958 [Elasticomyces elasticus]KAK4907195.1 hypothetical protein LTR49_023762 [Elasticomyces elasticus]KAK5747579.1 hypothetical protein LTS12_022370 [Elasticomyces elasticus]
MPGVLFAEAARQRQMENINMIRGKLDFDGVEPELGLHLLSLHWNRQHHSFLVTYRPAFMRDMACGGPYFSKILLNAIYYGASKFSSRLELRKDPTDVRTAGWRFRDRVRELLGRAMDRSEITTIQALLQMTSSLFALGDEQSAAWLYAGAAFRMIIDLGLHIDATLLPSHSNLGEEDLEIRRRVFWSAFVLDKIQSLYQGRLAALQHEDCQVPILFLDEYEELEHWLPFAYNRAAEYKGSPGYSVSTFTELCKLCIILNRILNRVYNGKGGHEQSAILLRDLGSLEADLNSWSGALPTHLQLPLGLDTSAVDAPPPHVLSLTAMGNMVRILLHRPFVSDGHLSSIAPEVAKSSFSTCATAATGIVQILRLYDQVFTIRRAPYLISYAAYLAATIHVRIAARRQTWSEAHSCLQTCLAVFEQNSETNHAVRKATMVIENLMKRMSVSVKRQEGPSSVGDTVEQMVQPQPDHAMQALRGSIGEETPWTGPGIGSSLAQPGFVDDIDIDAIIESFVQNQQMPGSVDPGQMAVEQSGFDYNLGSQYDARFPWSGMNEIDDTLFGFHTSGFDSLR